MSGRLPASFRERDFSRGKFSRLQLFRYVQASELACLPDRSYRCRFPRRAAEAFTSEQNVRRYLRTHRICSPPDYRQLAARGLSPREIHSIVDCSTSGIPWLRGQLPLVRWTAKCPEPLCPAGALPLPKRCHAPPRKALPFLHRSYGLTRQPNSLPPTSALASFGGSLQVIASSC